MGVGRRGSLTGHGLGHGEPATVARFQSLPGEESAVNARHASASENGRSKLAGDVLVAQILFQHFGRHALSGQSLLIAVLVELAGHLVEEGRDLTNFLQHQFLAGTDAGVPGPGQEAHALRLAFQILGVDVLFDHVVERNGATGLLLQVGAHAFEVRAELRAADAAVARVDDVFRAEARKHIRLSAHDQEAEDDQGEQADGPFRLGEVAEQRDHRDRT